MVCELPVDHFSPPFGTVMNRPRWGAVWQSHLVVTQVASPTSRRRVSDRKTWSWDLALNSTSLGSFVATAKTLENLAIVNLAEPAAQSLSIRDKHLSLILLALFQCSMITFCDGGGLSSPIFLHTLQFSAPGMVGSK
jgi:hypothetical protein